jgi:hypothetical protein
LPANVRGSLAPATPLRTVEEPIRPEMEHGVTSASPTLEGRRLA